MTALERSRHPDPFDLARFIEAQDPVYGRVRAELSDGRKASHWMWFVFPQIDGLGFSEMSRRYAIGSIDEARAYLADPVLGARLDECTSLVIAAADRPLNRILGPVDAVKFHSSMTLFARAAGPDSLSSRALDVFFGGEPDDATLTLLPAA
ncbi:DUF1810 domain-containing protein [Methylobrevis pamukkalensis]|uniref:Calpastatin n=1 Tax=Methylobrevis pamukkalensis TaxID=1439726 RepID=A0A1E3H2H5_9HYPH|nr:DUF1810 domain-containing protein [Methylobrevis pamukkalensis]ODN70512.1 hypothetical protein A6302_02188 [Methylobrevis pamukkalensis]